MELAESVYGSDRHGLIWAYEFAPGRRGREIESDTASQWLAAGPPHGSFLWLHFSLSNTAAERWMRDHLELPAAFYDSLRQLTATTRLEQDGDELVALVHDVLFDTVFDSASVSTVSLCVKPRLLISARLRPLRSVDRLRAAVKEGQTFESPIELMGQLLRDQANVLVEIVRQSTSRVDAIEDQLLSNRLTASRRELGALRRALVRLQRLLAPEPAALFRMLSRPPPWMTEEGVQDLRQAAEEFNVAVADSAALSERVRLLQEEMAALINEQTSRTLFVLTMVTVLALPINLMAGLFGMNVGGIPLADNSHGFLLIVGFVALVTAIVTYIVLGRRGD